MPKASNLKIWDSTRHYLAGEGERESPPSIHFHPKNLQQMEVETKLLANLVKNQTNNVPGKLTACLPITSLPFLRAPERQHIQMTYLRSAGVAKSTFHLLPSMKAPSGVQQTLSEHPIKLWPFHEDTIAKKYNQSTFHKSASHIQQRTHPHFAYLAYPSNILHHLPCNPPGNLSGADQASTSTIGKIIMNCQPRAEYVVLTPHNS